MRCIVFTAASSTQRNVDAGRRRVATAHFVVHFQAEQLYIRRISRPSSQPKPNIHDSDSATARPGRLDSAEPLACFNGSREPCRALRSFNCRRCRFSRHHLGSRTSVRLASIDKSPLEVNVLVMGTRQGDSWGLVGGSHLAVAQCFQTCLLAIINSNDFPTNKWDLRNIPSQGVWSNIALTVTRFLMVDCIDSELDCHQGEELLESGSWCLVAEWNGLELSAR